MRLRCANSISIFFRPRRDVTIFGALNHCACCTDLGLPDSSRRLDIDDDRRLQVDQVVIGVGKEGMPFVSASPLRGRIRPGDELWDRLAGCAPGSLI